MSAEIVEGLAGLSQHSGTGLLALARELVLVDTAQNAILENDLAVYHGHINTARHTDAGQKISRVVQSSG